MSTFTLAISYLTTSNLPLIWLISNLIHGPNIPGSYAILLFTASDFASITSHIHNWVLFLLWLQLFILELFLHCSPVAYWAPADGAFLFQYSIFLPFHTVHGFSRQEYWRPFPSPVDHVLSELSTVTRPSWVAPHSMAHIFFELNKTVVHKCNRFFQEEEDNRFWTIGKSFWGTKSCLWVRWK